VIRKPASRIGQGREEQLTGVDSRQGKKKEKGKEEEGKGGIPGQVRGNTRTMTPKKKG